MRIRLIVVGLVIAAIAIAMAVVAPRIHPIDEAPADIFWRDATSWEERGGLSLLWGTPIVREGYAYTTNVMYMHGLPLFRTPIADIEAAMPAIVAELAADDGTVRRPPWVMPAFHRWQEDQGKEDGAEPLLEAIRRERNESIMSRVETPGSFSSHMAQEDAYLESIYLAAKRFWWNMPLAGLYLVAWALFVLWPWLRRQSVWRWAIHLGFAPALLVWPVFCGYLNWLSAATPRIAPYVEPVIPWLVAYQLFVFPAFLGTALEIRRRRKPRTAIANRQSSIANA